MSRRSDWRNYHCDRCGKRLAAAHRDMLLLRRLTVDYANARSARRAGDVIEVTCDCGHVCRIPWPTIQR